MKKDDSVYLHHILDAIGRIKKYVQGVSEERFLASDLLQDAVVRQLEVIGEAARNVSSELSPSRGDSLEPDYWLAKPHRP